MVRMTSSISFPPGVAIPVQTIRSVGGTGAIAAPSALDRAPAQTASPATGPAMVPSASSPRGSLLNLTV